MITCTWMTDTEQREWKKEKMVIFVHLNSKLDECLYIPPHLQSTARKLI